MKRILAAAILALGLHTRPARAEKIPYANPTSYRPPPSVGQGQRGRPEKTTVDAPNASCSSSHYAPATTTRSCPRRSRLRDPRPENGAFDTTVTVDIEQLMPENLSKYDVLVLNNNCSKGPRRNLFLDELETNPSTPT